MRSLYIDGTWRDSSSDEALDVIDPATEQVIDRVPAGTTDDVDAAAEAAAAAFPAWAALSSGQRVTHLAKALELFSARLDEITALLTRDMGAPATFSGKVQAGLPALMFRTYIDLVEEHGERYFTGERIGNSLLVHEPVGVVGAITPWNYPLHQIVLKAVPALLAGNTVVLKPSEIAPLSAYALTEVFDGAGLPPGVFNLVSGTGPVVGEAIAAHPKVDMVSFTGSTRAGTRVSEVAAATIKRVALELGGKSPDVILPGADLPQAIKRGVADVMRNTGQSCDALTRTLIHRDSYEEAVELAVAAAAKYVPGDPTDESTRLGPLVSAAQLERVRAYIDLGVEEGARLVTGGSGPVEGMERGYYVAPTIFADVRNDMRIAREEIFGPVMSLIPYDTVEEAVRIANDTVYGLSASVWSAEPEEGMAVARALRAGQVRLNGGALNPRAPFGGYKRSGNGREWGLPGLEEFCEVKAVQT
ncbi:aldehyde dehydrogenase family protein [Nocardiopsis alba]|uniref:aldehyde dehydrogenase family protein n=1 Tax=Nocardiopsis alba TaxID=53437 RepID=UPI00366B5190